METIQFKELDYQAGELLPTHKHAEGQVLFTRSGTMEITAGEDFIFAPASRVVWIPPKVDHSIRFRTNTKMRTAYILPHVLIGTFKNICVFQASPLFREILIRLAEDRLNDQMFKEMLELSLIKEMCLLKNEPFSIKFPEDNRAKRVATILLDNPSKSQNINEWAKIAACSSKTLSRLFIKETGMTFQIWRRHLRLLLSQELLYKDYSITEVAHALGFSSSSAFAEAHRKTFGFPPSKISNREQIEFRNIYYQSNTEDL